MKKTLLAALLLITGMTAMQAETVELQGKSYECQRLVDREIGPGIQHMRFRLPGYPLNIDVLKVDLNNPYNRIETTVANETACGTERLDAAAKRQSSASHRALAGANANFWVVATQKEEYVYTGTTRNASIRNGKMVTESNQHRDQWDGGTMRTGVVALSYDKTAYIDYCTSTITVTSPAIGTMDVHQSNKGVHDNELCMYNSFYGANKEFKPLKIESGKYQLADAGDATEVLLDMVEGQGWDSGRDIDFIVKEVRLNGGKGKLGQHDLALVGRGANRDAIAKLKEGDKVTLKYTWTYNPGTADEVTPLVEQAVGPNALVMRNGELTAHNTNETYNSQVYSRTGYGCSADGKTVYIVVIDKATHPIYGGSAGCSTTIMCEFARWLGCSNMANFDAGGSAQMMINGKIDNKTTEGTARAVANGWLVYSIAPEDAADYNTVARLEFDDLELQAPIYSSFTPTVIAYNRYGAVLDYDFKDFTLSCDPSLGTCTGNVFTASGNPGTSGLTISYGNASTTRDMTVLNAKLSMRVKPILIDAAKEYTIEVTAAIGDNVYNYDSSAIEWTSDNTEVATIDASGTLRGHSEGTANISGKIGDFTDTNTVTVEISPAAELSNADWEGWTTKSPAGISNHSVSADGTIKFTYASPRSPYIQVAKSSTFYSIPSSIFIEFTPSVAVSELTVDFRAAYHTKSNLVTVSPTEGSVFEAGKEYKVEIPISLLGDPTDIANYPVTIEFIRFVISPDSGNAGEQTIKLGKLTATYTSYASLDDTDDENNMRAFTLTPNPVRPGAMVQLRTPNISRVEIFSTAGMLLSSVDGYHADALTFRAPTGHGAYVVRVYSGTATHSAFLIVN